MQWRRGPRQHIHSVPNTARFEKDEWGEIYPVQTPRVHVIYPDQFHKGLWGGEGVIKGMLKRPDGNHRNFTPPGAKYWWPRLFEGVVHSEILDAYIDVVCPKRGGKSEVYDKYQKYAVSFEEADWHGLSFREA